MRRTLVGLLSLSAAVGLGVATGATASATPQGAYGCTGSRVGTYNIKNTDGSTWGSIYLYYSSASGGTNCAVNAAKKYAGQRHLLEVRISSGSQADSDDGIYTEYAGPVKLTHMDGKCVTLSGWVTAPGNGAAVGDQWTNVHCG
ncbi:hypothetical protein ACFY93_09760 [Streptomyces sp. NPDC008313]|uniref:hypothetical protein n=1 Tax=Streptomyces sp. NPDC008313 TaxID=3364826 RepID=UPI0036E3C09F